MEKSAQKGFDRADIVRDVRFSDLPGVDRRLQRLWVMYTADMIGIVAVFSLLAKFAIGEWIMAIPSSSTFRYLTTVPEGGTHACPWKMESRETLKATGDPLDDNRLVGWNPLLQISDAGVTPNPGPARPAVVRSELRLVATD